MLHFSRFDERVGARDAHEKGVYIAFGNGRKGVMYHEVFCLGARDDI